MGYPLRIDHSEFARLDRQARALRPATRLILEMAGLREGMRVLDLGTGAGDLALIARELVGPSGQVTGIDRSPDAVARATARAESEGLTNVTFRVQDMQHPGEETVDAVIGRLVLMYPGQPEQVLREHAANLAAGGVVVAIEFDVFSCRSLPTTPLVDHFVASLGEAFVRGGVEMSMGPRLWALLTAAGLEPAGMIGVQPHFGPEDADGVDLLDGILRSSAPLIERTGMVVTDDLRPDGFADRLAAELAGARAVLAYPMLFGAWGTPAV